MTDQTVLIIGASRGLGLGLAAEYLARGRRVIGTVREGSPGDLPALAASSGGRLTVEKLDVTDPRQIGRASCRERV